MWGSRTLTADRLLQRFEDLSRSSRIVLIMVSASWISRERPMRSHRTWTDGHGVGGPYLPESFIAGDITMQSIRGCVVVVGAGGVFGYVL